MVTRHSHNISPMLPAMPTTQAMQPTNPMYKTYIEETRLFTIAAEPEAGISTYHKWWRIWALGFYPTIPETDEGDEREGKRTSQPSNSSQRTTIWFCIIFTYFIY